MGLTAVGKGQRNSGVEHCYCQAENSILPPLPPPPFFCLFVVFFMSYCISGVILSFLESQSKNQPDELKNSWCLR